MKKQILHLSPELIVITLAILGLISQACGVKASHKGNAITTKPDEEQKDNEDDSKAQEPEKVEEEQKAEEPAKEPDLKDLYTSLGIKDFEQIPATMMALTGVNVTTTNVATAYKDLKSQLPLFNDIKAFSGSNQVAISKLAVEFCDALFTDTTLRASFVPGLDFAQAPTVALTQAGKDLLVNTISDKILRVNSSAETKAALMQLLNDILTGKTLTTVALTANVAKGVCSSALSSASIMIL